MSSPALNTSLDRFDELGYVVIEGLLAAERAAALYDSFDQVTAGRRSANERMLLRDERFLDLVRTDALLHAARAVIGDDLQLLALDSLETPSGGGRDRDWHADFRPRIPATVCANAGVYLTDMDDRMGPLRVIAGSHRWDRGPSEEEAGRPLEGEIPVAVRAGDAVLFDAQLWHTGGPNGSDRPRRAVFAYFGRYWMKRMDEFFEAPLPETITQSGDPLVRQLFGLGLTVSSAHGDDYRADNPRWR